MAAATTDVSTIAKPNDGGTAAERTTAPVATDAFNESQTPLLDAHAAAIAKLMNENAALIAVPKINAGFSRMHKAMLQMRHRPQHVILSKREP